MDVLEKGTKSSNVKECANSGLNTLQQGVILCAYTVTTVLGWAFTLTYGWVTRVGFYAGTTSGCSRTAYEHG